MPPEPDPTTPRRPRGHALPRSGVDLDRMSEVTDLDIARARKTWLRLAPELSRGLIEAKPATKPDDGTPPDTL